MPEHLLRFEDAIGLYHAEIYHYVWRLLAAASRSEGAQEADDIVQDTFERAYQAFPRLRPNSNVRAWLYKIATNRTYTSLAKTGRSQPLGEADDEFPDPSQPLDQGLSWNETREVLYRHIKALPPSQRAALVMRHLHDLEYAEIAEALNCSEESARANVSHALRRLRRELAESSQAER